MPALPAPPVDVDPPHSNLTEALRRHITKQRRLKIEEAEQNLALQQERKEREERKQRDADTLDKTNSHITKLRDKMELLQKEKHDLFAQLKKVVALEDEQKKRMVKIQLQHEKEAKEVLEKVSRAPTLSLPGASGAPPPPPPPKPPLITNTPNPHATPVTVKRPRSPSPHTSPYYHSPKHLGSPSFSRSPYQSQTKLTPSASSCPPGGGYTATLGSSGAFGSSSGMVGPLPPPPPPPRVSHITPSGIPVVTPQKQLGSITAGFPVQKSVQPPLQHQQSKNLYPQGRQFQGGPPRFV